MDIEHDPVNSSIGFVKLFKSEVRNQTSTEKEECVNTWKTIEDCLECIRRCDLQDKAKNK
jgi:hypothetical protein